MNRRQFALALSATATGLIGCDTEQKPSSTATLLNNEDVQNAMKALSSAISDLESEVTGFDGGNWREVVPNVQTGASNVSYAFQKLRDALGVKN